MHARSTRRRVRLASALASALALAVLAGGSATAAKPSGTTTPTITFTPLLGAYDRPILVTNDGVNRKRLYIVEQTGRIRIARLVDGTWRKAGVFLDLSTKVLAPPTGGSEQGLLGLAFPPDYATSGRFYVDYTRQGSEAKVGDTVLAEYRRKGPLTADPSSARLLKVIQQPFENHNGGNLAFGPDGFLYVGLGDGGSGGDPGDRAQDLGLRLGKLLRISPRDPDGAGPKRYGVPASNPYVGETEKNSEIWLSGVRNPWRWSFDRLTGDLWIGDVGQGDWEEIDFLPATDGRNAGKGLNLGWNVCEGDRTYPGGDPCQHASLGFTAPIFTYGHEGTGPMDGGCSVTGGHVVRAPGATAWQGLGLFADICSRKVGVLSADGTLLLVQGAGHSITSFGEDRSGRLYVVDLDGNLTRLDFVGDPSP